MNRGRAATNIRGCWSLWSAEEKLPERREIMLAIVKEIMLGRVQSDDIDRAVYECAVHPALFEQGMSIVMLASDYVRDAFRARLVECGALMQAMRLVTFMDRPLSRDEIVTLGNYHRGGLVHAEVAQFLLYAEKTEGITPLDLRRLRKQLESKAA